MRNKIQGNTETRLIRVSCDEAQRLYDGGKYILVDDGKSRVCASKLTDMVKRTCRSFPKTTNGKPVFYSLIL